MRVLHTLLSISRKGGGVQNAVLSLAKTMAMNPGISSVVFAPADEFSDVDSSRWLPLVPSVFQLFGPAKLAYVPSMLKNMLAINADIQHSHGLWLYLARATVAWSQATGRAYVVSPHGMLEASVELRNSRFKKRLALAVYQMRHLRLAGCIHALCGAEARDVRRFGLKNPIALIPNGVNLPPTKERPSPPWKEAIAPGRKVLLYLGRIHPQKGLAGLIEAVAALKRDGAAVRPWSLAVVGWDQQGHTLCLERQIKDLGLSEEIKLLGPLFGDDRDAAYRCADTFVLPSSSEGLPLAVIEAWSYGLPVLMTPHCNIPEGFTAGAAIRADPTPADLARGLRTLFSMSDGDRHEMGQRGLGLVQQKFMCTHVAAQMKAVYDWMVGGGPAPSSLEMR